MERVVSPAIKKARGKKEVVTERHGWRTLNQLLRLQVLHINESGIWVNEKNTDTIWEWTNLNNSVGTHKILITLPVKSYPTPLNPTFQHFWHCHAAQPTFTMSGNPHSLTFETHRQLLLYKLDISLCVMSLDPVKMKLVKWLWYVPIILIMHWQSFIVCIGRS